VVDDIEEFGLLIKAVAREADRHINDLLRPLGITASQAEALQLLQRYGPLSLGELGELLVAEGGHPSRLIDRLVAAGLVDRHPTTDDRRRLALRCTPKGSELARQARTRKEVLRAELTRRLGELDLASAKTVLTACLADTPLGQTVRQRQARSTTSGQPTG
jgi:MarR family transcriptional regulator, organic hydroperoxide resistance regulator